MFVVFEGIDGSGKTTLSNRVAQALRAAGLAVSHVREDGKYASKVADAIRELGRDAKNLELNPLAELLLHAAREAQLLDEVTRPALAASPIVIADRFFYTAEVLAMHARGLAADQVLPVVRAASRGLEPDLVVLVDVDPQVARARKRIAELLAPRVREPSRKGLGGAGMQHRMRAGYLELARRDPARWVVVDNTEADLEALVMRIALLLGRAFSAGVEAATRLASEHRPASRPLLADATPEAARAALLAWSDRHAERQPNLAAYFLRGLWGGDIDERRVALAARAPEVVAYGLRGLADAVSFRLRDELMSRVPALVARSLGALAGDVGDQLQRRLGLWAPEAVALSLKGRDDAAAWRLRERLGGVGCDAVIASLAGLGSRRAWELREQWLGARGGAPALEQGEPARTACQSIAGLEDARAWELRRLGFESAPVAALASLSGATRPQAWMWREKYLERAPKIILRGLRGLTHARAWRLRQAAALGCKEALESMIGLEHSLAWRIREQCADLWPAAVVGSLGVLAQAPRGRNLMAEQLARHPDDLSLWRHAAATLQADTVSERVQAYAE